MTSDTKSVSSPLQSMVINPRLLEDILAKLGDLQERVGQGEKALADCRLCIQDIESEIKDAGHPAMTDDTTTSNSSSTRTNQAEERAKVSDPQDLGQTHSRGTSERDKPPPAPALPPSTLTQTKETVQPGDEDSEVPVSGEGDKETSGPSFSARASGPLDHIPGMKDGSGGQRILPKEREVLPTMIQGNSYSCEAMCGYPDWACEMIRCDSARHPELPTMRFPGEGAIERSWYHKPCGGMSVYYFPGSGEKFTCPSCARKGSPSYRDDRVVGDNAVTDEDGQKNDTEDDPSRGHQPQDTPDTDSREGFNGDGSKEGGDQNTEDYDPPATLAQGTDDGGNNDDTRDGDDSLAYGLDEIKRGRKSSNRPTKQRSADEDSTKGDQNARRRQSYVETSQKNAWSHKGPMERRLSIEEKKMSGRRIILRNPAKISDDRAEIKYEKGYILYESDDDYSSSSSSKRGTKSRSMVNVRNISGKQRGRQSQTKVDHKQKLAELDQVRAQVLDTKDKNDQGIEGDGSPGDGIWKTKDGEPWTEEENVLCMQLMTEICKAGIIPGEGRFIETSRRMKSAGYNRNWTGVKNAWNRRLRARSNLDERRKKGPVLATSKQDKNTKKANLEKRKERELKQSSKKERVSPRDATSSSGSPKRELEPDEDEVMPPKRRRAAPQPADFSAGLP